MNKAAAIAILAVIVAGCAAGPGEVGRTGYEEYRGAPGYSGPAEPNFPTGVPGTGVPGDAPGGIK